jgi:zinc protease
MRNAKNVRIGSGRVLLAAVLIAVAPACATARAGAGAFPTTPPPALQAVRLEFPDFHETVLPNGLRLIVLEHRAQPLVGVTLFVNGGSSAEPAGRAGLAGMTADLLTKGTPARSATEIAEAIERVGGTLSATPSIDWITLSANVLADHLPLALELVSESAMRPTFPESEVELTRRRTLSSLQAALGQPATLAQRAFDREVYGAAHPYGIAPVGATVQEITRAEIVGFHETLFGASNALLVIAGAVTPAEAEALARRHFGEWRRGQPVTVTYPLTTDRERTTIRLVHRPGSAQTNLLVGHLGYRLDNPDHFALVVLNGMIGGNFNSRLNQVLREERGWTYGAFSRFTRPREIGNFAASAEVRTEVADSALAEMLSQLRRIRDEPVPQGELDAAKSFLAGSFPLRIETMGQIASQIATTRLLGLPVENLREYRERVMAVTAADVQRVAREHVRPDRSVIVVVGDAAQLLDRLRPIAPVEVVNVEGQLVDPETLLVLNP